MPTFNNIKDDLLQKIKNRTLCLQTLIAFLVLASTLHIALAHNLIQYYHLTKLTFWSYLFKSSPELMLFIGSLTLGVCIIGYILISFTDNRYLVGLLAVLLAIIVILMIASVGTAISLKSVINTQEISETLVLQDMEHYGEKNYPHVTSKWDQLQREVRCCGGLKFTLGYQSWMAAMIGKQKNSVPDSCCHMEVKDCGKGLASQRPGIINPGIYRDGCITILKIKLVKEVIPILDGYIGFGVIIVLVEILTILMAFYHAYQLHKQENTGSQHVENELQEAPLQRQMTEDL